MANKVKIKIRIRTADGSRRFQNPAYAKNGKLKPLVAMVGGKEEQHPEGEYWLRYWNGKQRWDRVGPDAQLAMVEQIKRQRSLEATAAGVQVVEPVKPASGYPIRSRSTSGGRARSR